MNHKLGKLAVAALSACVLATQSVHAVEFGAFGNVNLEKKQGSSTTFALGGLDLFARQDISDKSSALVEYVIESGDGTSFVLDLERFVVDYEFSRALTVSAGRIHSHAGYWNTAFHHGQFLQPTVSRPEFLAFEDGQGASSAVHLIGLFADGEFSSAAGVFKYHAAYANNPQVDTTAVVANREIFLSMNSDPDSGKTIAGKISFEPDRTPIQIGVYAQKGSYSSTTTGIKLADQNILAVDLHANMGNLDFLTEYYNYSNQDLVAATSSTSTAAYYVQLAYTAAEVWTPVVRYEKRDQGDATDPFANGALFTRDGYKKITAAVRYDVDESNAITLEYSKDSPDIGASHQKAAVQWSFMMF